eukprot:1129043-Pelagomonas_calceolata.AAC.1
MACDPANLSQFVVELDGMGCKLIPVATLLIQCLNTCTWIFPIKFFATLPDSGCWFTLFKLNRSALFVKSMPQSLSTTSLFYISMSSKGCPQPRQAV